MPIFQVDCLVRLALCSFVGLSSLVPLFPRSLLLKLVNSSTVLLVQKRLEDERGGYLVDYPLVLLACVAGLVQNLVSLVGGQALVPQMDWQAGEFAELEGKSMGFFSLPALFAGQAEGIADYDRRNIEFPGEAGNRAKVFARAAFPFEGKDRLGSEAQFIGHGDTNSPVSHIQTEEARYAGLLGPGSGMRRMIHSASVKCAAAGAAS